jgi:chromosomal replication initiation ATPase DnaA
MADGANEGGAMTEYIPEQISVGSDPLLTALLSYHSRNGATPEIRAHWARRVHQANKEYFASHKDGAKRRRTIERQVASLNSAQNRFENISGKTPRVEDLIHTACNFAGIERNDFWASRRPQHVNVRWAVIYALRQHRKDLSFPAIADRLGYKDHTALVGAMQQIENKRANDSNFAELLTVMEGVQ